ncbi:hypothetical protein [Subtercola endophyticus]|uniref:hypothetical protein n=1 Tax=Subtercola endophyticus TaxID=2895559 RepID=UPI001E3D535C|nr:hypothetical protein [Subtercola endophyticus]UFS59506.1 hypothetical protein LQ955_01510 [Subtercola endophyticus]
MFLPLVFAALFVQAGVEFFVDGEFWLGVFAVMLGLCVPLMVLDGFNAGEKRIIDKLLAIAKSKGIS